MIFVFTLLVTCNVFSQNTTTPTPVGWERIYIKNIGYFDLPPTMEVQKGKYKEFIDELKQIKGYDATQLTAQQKGLNELGKEGFEKLSNFGWFLFLSHVDPFTHIRAGNTAAACSQ